MMEPYKLPFLGCLGLQKSNPNGEISPNLVALSSTEAERMKTIDFGGKKLEKMTKTTG
jgi:hypothetical protein